MTTNQIYCTKCGFPEEYCEYSPVCLGNKKEVQENPQSKITVSTKRVGGNKLVTIVRNLHLFMKEQQMKDFSKKCSKTIACGSSLIKNGSGTEDVYVQTKEDSRVIDLLVAAGITREKIEKIEKTKSTG